ncbi:phasin family protein [Geomonas sp. RF6]|uniref:phasin family protein n=1 Tax=Geomonas sp. RF6 TaxID=2897342 RepID=UPI001E34D4AA|nr:phasin family protein [Geomonas sp. RF6]UFS72507.1 phasin family protein [Geomonas sp. RF6]
MRDKLEQLMYFGLGAAILAKEKLEQAGESTRGFREEGDRRAREFFEKTVAKGTEEREQVKSSIKDLLKEAMDELGLAKRTDVTALRAEVDALRAELARSRQGQP